MSIRVVHFMRKPSQGNYSVERMFEDVRAAPADGIDYAVYTSARPSQGIVRRLQNLVEAPKHQGDVNHVTGDVHFLTYLLKKKRTVLTVLDCLTLDRLQGWRRALFWLLWFWLPLRRVSHVTVISEFTKQQLQRHVKFPDERMLVIYPALSHEFTPAPKTLDLVTPRVLQIGSSPNKNLARIIEALAGIPCVLVTIGVLAEKSRDAMNSAGITWENHLDLSRAQLLDQYRSADIVMFPSTYEGFGFPIVEANAIGRPVITGNVASMPEVAGDAACIVDPFDVGSIRAGVQRLLADPGYCEELIDAGFRNAARFQLSTIASQYQALYRRVGAEL